MAKADENVKENTPVEELVDDNSEVLEEVPAQKVTKSAVKKYYLEAEGGANYEQIASKFNVDVEAVRRAIEE